MSRMPLSKKAVSRIKRFFETSRTEVTRRRPTRPALEGLEERVVLSTVSDSGSSTLTIALADNETFGIQSLGTAYQFTLSGTGTFTNGGVAASFLDFSGFSGSAPRAMAAGWSTRKVTRSNGMPPMKLVEVVW